MSVDNSGSSWKPFDQPIRESIEDGAPSWRDNAWLCFWDLEQGVFGEFHVSTSPNGGGCRARCSLHLDGRTVELVEEPRPGTFVSDSIDFSGIDRLEARSERVKIQIQVTPRFGLADFSHRNTLIGLVPGEPLHHYMRAATVTGTAELDGRTVAIDGVGFRDRTWGYRDESAAWAEYVGINAVFPEFSLVSVMFRGTDGSLSREGYVLGAEDTAVEVKNMSVTRDASGLLAATSLKLDDASTLDLTVCPGGAGFWVPMGSERTGPTMSAYAEFFPVRDANGEEGVGRFEQGVLRTLY